MKVHKALLIDKKEFYKWVWLVLLTFPYIKPDYIGQVAVLDVFFDVGRIVSSFIIVFWIFVKKIKISKIAILICFAELYVFAITYIRNGDTWKCMVASLSAISIVFLYDIVKGGKILFSSQMFCFEVVIYINLITEILFPETMYVVSSSADNLNAATRCWFLGYYNNHSKWFIPALLFAFLYKNVTGRKLRTYCLTIAIFISALIVWSGGVLISVFSMALVYILFKNETKIFNYYSYWTLQVIFFIVVIILKLQNLFRWFIDNVLGKWGSLESRMLLWEKTLYFIRKHPILGHGMWRSIDREIELNITWGCHAHNLLLEILYQGGIIYLFLFVYIILTAGKSLFLYRDSERSKIIAIAFLGWCMHSMVDPFISPFLIGMFVIAYHSYNDY